jgi:hypothetical protein
MSYRDDLAALSARHDALATEVAHKTRELENASQLLDDAKARSRLPILDNIRIASPCTADWSKMTGDERVRHCGDCKKNVYNLSDMTRDEAEAVIIEKEGRLCIRYYQRTDGTILLKDCTVGVSRRRRRRLVAAGAIAMLAGGGALVWRSMRESEPKCSGEREVMMGQMVVPQHHEMKGEMIKEPEPTLHQGLPMPPPEHLEVKMGKMSK